MSTRITAVVVSTAALMLAGCGESDTESPKPSADASSPVASPSAAPQADSSSPSADAAPQAGSSSPSADAATGGAAPQTTTPSAPASPADTAGSAEPPSSDKSGDVTAAQTGTMDAYLDTFDELLTKVGGVKTQMDTAVNSPKIKGLVDQLGGYATQLEEYSPETMTKLRELYSDNLSTLKSRFDSELTRLRANDNFTAIADLLEQVKLP